MKKTYIYDGPVKSFGEIVNRRWTGETTAVSASKARSNLVYRYKRENHRSPDSRITLPGALRAVN